ncbi:MAG: hypothetical protein HeimC2_00650 [Candidatus Heimdallarchaeota archaeon LC_2]|nr:MAG: hypothetical protein HeimC2_00650 [Candidatus Heimdallarchaeota archaeon LC_2]
MAIRDEKPNFLSTSEINVDLPRIDGSKIKTALAAIVNKLKSIRLTRTPADPNNFDVDKARELHTANVQNTADVAHLYARKY